MPCHSLILAHRMVLDALQQRLHALAVCSHGTVLCIAQVATVDLDDDLVCVGMAPILAPGFDAPAAPWTLSVAWPQLVFEPALWHAQAPPARWQLEFDLRRIGALCRFAASLDCRMSATHRRLLLQHQLHALARR